MTTYKETNGSNIEVLSSDPANPLLGQIWYNSTSNVLKGLRYVATGAWASATALPGADRGCGYSGTATAGLVFAGNAGGPRHNLTYEYNGSSWTSGGNMNTTKNYITGCGIQTATLAFGGEAGASGCYATDYASCTAEQYNGSSWTTTTNAPYDGGATNMAGTSTSAITAGDGRGTPAAALQGLLFNSGSWTAAPNMNTGVPARSQCGILGTSQSSVIFAGGDNGTSPPFIANVEQWNGSTWTEITDLNTGRGDPGGAGSVTAGLVFGGKTGPATYTGATESWNGSAWTEEGDLSASRGNSSGNRGTSTSTWAAGGESPGAVTTVEEWTGAGSPVVQTFTDS